MLLEPMPLGSLLPAWLLEPEPSVSVMALVDDPCPEPPLDPIDMPLADPARRIAEFCGACPT